MLMNPQWMKNDTTRQTVEVYPPDSVQRRWVRWGGIAAEIVRATRRERLEFHFRAPVHLLAVCDRGVRRDGDTFLEGLPRSKRRDVRRRLTFVPAGHAYHEWQEPRVLARMVYFYFDPAAMPTPVTLAQRLFFEDADLADTALKLTRLIEQGGPESGPYFDALGIVLAYELLRLDSPAAAAEVRVRGGLAAWQQRAVTGYIEDHLAEPIPLAALARLARLSPHYFCRAFKQSFGMPPHRYHNSRRIERAKALLAKPLSSVTTVGFTLGFGETSSFSAAFRKTTGFTPTAYRRAVAPVHPQGAPVAA
jgi:AraC family transcriptional regulator